MPEAVDFCPLLSRRSEPLKSSPEKTTLSVRDTARDLLCFRGSEGGGVCRFIDVGTGTLSCTQQDGESVCVLLSVLLRASFGVLLYTLAI